MSQDKKHWHLISNVDELDSPALVVYPERVKYNIQLAIKMVGNVQKLRPHIKTNKSKEVTLLMMQAGISKFKCATISEAEILAQCNAKDVLLAYQPLGPKLKRFVSLIQKYPATQFSCLTDNMDAASEQANAFNENQLSVPVYIDLNVGMNRTGIPPGNNAIELYKYCSTLKGIQVAGLHAYDGHLRDIDIEERRKKCNAGFDAAEEMKKRLVEEEFSVHTIIAGGSPTFPIHAERKDVECSPGTFVYWDKGYNDLCPEQEFLTAAVLVTRVISLPAPDRICIDLGHKSVASENEIRKRVFFLNADNLEPVGQSEEHFVLEAKEGHGYKVGDVFYGLPYHICPTVALYERIYTVENGRVTGEWKNMARDRKLTI